MMQKNNPFQKAIDKIDFVKRGKTKTFKLPHKLRTVKNTVNKRKIVNAAN